MPDQSLQEHKFLLDFVCQVTAASEVVAAGRVQSLWSGYGEIRRYQLKGTGDPQLASVIVKDINPPASAKHPRGWNTDISHQRKLRSYEVEAHWYRQYVALFSEMADADCRVASCYGVTHSDNRQLIVMQDLDTNYPRRISSPEINQIESCLQWLANFHAKFLNAQPDGLWSTGTYWHLDTRPDELAVMADGALKEAAAWLDKQLSDCPYQTLVHGDAKMANFCFSQDGLQAAAVDFQYTGGGIGIRDVAYLLGSCMSEQELHIHDRSLLDFYHARLVSALQRYHPQVPADDVADAWVNLFEVAWTDFYRFLAGWMPDHPKSHAYTLGLAEKVLAEKVLTKKGVNY